MLVVIHRPTNTNLESRDSLIKNIFMRKYPTAIHNANGI